METRPGVRLSRRVAAGVPVPAIGVYDVFSATLAARYFDTLFVSGFSFAASHYGLPDIGFIAWPDIVSFVQRIRSVLPEHNIIVDIDDGYCDTETACHVVRQLEQVGASGVILEDQKRPRRCGHYDGKQLMELEPFVAKLARVLDTRKDLFVVARTDSADPDDIVLRTSAFAAAGADAILVDGLKSLSLLKPVRERVSLPLVFNQIAGGKSPLCTLEELGDAGVGIAIYSTPCLFAAQDAITSAMQSLLANDGLLRAENGVTVRSCTAVLNANLPQAPERAAPAPMLVR